MIYVSELKKEYFTTGDIAKLVGLNYRTVALHQKRNLINMKRNKINSRFYATIEDVLDYLDKLGIPYKDDRSKNRINIIYARVSSNEQKQKGDLDRQVGYISSKCNKSNPFEIITDVGSGLNTDRKGLNKLIKYVIEDKVDTVYVRYKDRLTRFGYDYLEKFFQSYNVNIVILEETESKTNQEELVDDMMSLIASFSGKFYGLRSKEKKLLYKQLENTIEK